MPKFQYFGGGGYSGQVKTENTQSAKICLGGDGGKLGKLGFFNQIFNHSITVSLSHTYVETKQCNMRHLGFIRRKDLA